MQQLKEGDVMWVSRGYLGPGQNVKNHYLYHSIHQNALPIFHVCLESYHQTHPWWEATSCSHSASNHQKFSGARVKDHQSHCFRQRVYWSTHHNRSIQLVNNRFQSLYRKSKSLNSEGRFGSFLQTSLSLNDKRNFIVYETLGFLIQHKTITSPAETYQDKQK